MKKALFPALCLLAALAIACGEKDNPAKPSPAPGPEPQDTIITTAADSMDIYLLIGQSNMAGRAPMIEGDQDTIAGVWLLTPEGKIEKAANPLNKYSSVRKDLSVQKIGPGFGFCTSLRERTGRPLLLVVNARGGTAIGEWVKGTNYFNEAVRRTMEALPYGKLKGILWHQGESNSSSYRSYMNSLKAMVADLRDTLQAPELPFIAGEIQHDHSNACGFNKQLQTICEHIPYSGWVSAQGLTLIEDNVHHDRRSQILLGQRYADAVYAMVYAPGPAESYSVEFPELYLSAKEVLLDGKKDSEVQLDIVTNQIPVSIHVPSDAASWLSVELSGDKILCKALADNEADDPRMATVTITAGAESISLAVTQNGTSVIGQVWGTEGVIFWENPDKPGEYKIVSAKAEKRPWGPAGATVGVNSSSIDGLTAAAKMRAMPDYTTASYAQQFCDALGDDWYLPNRSEGDALFLAYDGQTYFAKDGSGTATKDVPNNCTAAEKARRAAFDWALTSLPNGVALNTQDGSQNGDSIWLCYETSSGNGYYYRYGSPGCSYGTKSSTNRFARCIKVVQSE